MPIIFVMQGKCLLRDISRSDKVLGNFEHYILLQKNFNFVGPVVLMFSFLYNIKPVEFCTVCIFFFISCVINI